MVKNVQMYNIYPNIIDFTEKNFKTNLKIFEITILTGLYFLLHSSILMLTTEIIDFSTYINFIND